MPDGSEKPIAFVSRSLSKAEQNYLQLDREGLAVMFGLKRLHKMLYGRPFTIVTDCKPLMTLFSELKAVPQMASPRIQRWAVILRAYEYTIEHRASSLMEHADALSRLKPLPETPFYESADRVLLLEEVQDTFPLTTEQVKEWTNKDIVLSRVRQKVLHGWPETNDYPDIGTYFSRRTELSVCDGCLLWGSRLIVPQQACKAVKL